MLRYSKKSSMIATVSVNLSYNDLHPKTTSTKS